MADFVATETQRETLFTQGVVAFEVPLLGLRAVTGRREAWIADFLADRVPGALCIEVLGGPGEERDTDALMRGWIAELGLAARGDRPDTNATGFYEVPGHFSALKALKDAAVGAGLRLFQAWYYLDAMQPGAPVDPAAGVDPLAPYAVDVFEQFYGALDPAERAALLAEPECRVQLYDEGCFISLHQDGVETVLRQGVVIEKRCVVLCYLSDDWHAAAGGELECLLDVPREVVLGESDEDWDARPRVVVPPRLGTFVILDFTRFNDPHIVHPVTDGRFVRKMFGWSFATARR